MKVFLTDNTAAQITQEPLEHAPRFSFSGPQVVVGPYANAEDREHDIARTFGSMQWLWSETDDVRFHNSDRLLRSLVLYAPEVTESVPAVGRLWTEVSVVTGGLRAENEAEFDLPQTVTRWCDPEARHLVCLGESPAQPSGDRFRLRVAPDTDLLFQGRHLAGWMITDPARYLSMGWERPEPSPPEVRTRSLLAECLALTAEPLVDDVMDGDGSVWQRLRDVANALHCQSFDRTRAKILTYTMDHLIESYS